MPKPDVRGPECPITGRTVAEELQHAVAMMTTDRIGVRDGVRYDADEFRAYCDGYYRAVAQALAIMQLALERRRLRLGHVKEVQRWQFRPARNSSARSVPIAPSRSNARATASSARRSPAHATRRRSSAATASSTPSPASKGR